MICEGITLNLLVNPQFIYFRMAVSAEGVQYSTNYVKGALKRSASSFSRATQVKALDSPFETKPQASMQVLIKLQTKL